MYPLIQTLGSMCVLKAWVSCSNACSCSSQVGRRTGTFIPGGTKDRYIHPRWDEGQAHSSQVGRRTGTFIPGGTKDRHILLYIHPREQALTFQQGKQQKQSPREQRRHILSTALQNVYKPAKQMCSPELSSTDLSPDTPRECHSESPIAIGLHGPHPTHTVG